MPLKHVQHILENTKLKLQRNFQTTLVSVVLARRTGRTNGILEYIRVWAK